MLILHDDDYSAGAQRVSDHLQRLAARPDAPQCLGTLNAGTDSTYSLTVKALATLSAGVLATKVFTQDHGGDPADFVRCQSELNLYIERFRDAAKASGVKSNDVLYAMPVSEIGEDRLYYLDLLCVALGATVAKHTFARFFGTRPNSDTRPAQPAA